MSARWADIHVDGLLWLLATILLYLAVRAVHRRWPYWWTGPVTVVPPLLATAVLLSGSDYADYARYSYGLVTLLGPATVAFALPIYEHRAMIARDWPLLLVGVTVGSLVSILGAVLMARLFAFDPVLSASLLPKSMTSPFVMPFAAMIGGDANLAAAIVVLTGVFGGMLGGILLRLPVRTPIAKGAMFGMGAHGVGTVYAYGLGRAEGSVAGLGMVLIGTVNILAVTLFTLIKTG